MVPSTRLQYSRSSTEKVDGLCRGFVWDRVHTGFLNYFPGQLKGIFRTKSWYFKKRTLQKFTVKCHACLYNAHEPETDRFLRNFTVGLQSSSWHTWVEWVRVGKFGMNGHLGEWTCVCLNVTLSFYQWFQYKVFCEHAIEINTNAPQKGSLTRTSATNRIIEYFKFAFLLQFAKMSVELHTYCLQI